MKETSPFFSVVTPIYNAEDYLEECIQSVLKQTFADWELILVDDGSSDGSGAICDKYSLKDSRIRVIHQENAGELHSRLKGIQNASGQYELQLDADDYLEKNALELLKTDLDRTNCDAIMYRIRYCGKRTGGEREVYEERVLTSREEIVQYSLMNHSMCDKAIRVDLAKNIDFSNLDKSVRFSLDYAQSVPVMCGVNTCYLANHIIYNYRIHDASICNVYDVNKVYDICKVNEFVLHYLDSKDLLDEVVEQYIAITFLKELEWRFMSLYIEGELSKTQWKKIVEMPVFKYANKHLTIRNLGVKKYITLKTFVSQGYFLLDCIKRIMRS